MRNFGYFKTFFLSCLDIDPLAFESLGPTLQYLNLDNNRLKRMPWVEFGNLTSLKHLYLGNNLISDDSLEGVEVESVGFRMGDGAPGQQFDCTHLQYLGLNGNSLSRLPVRILRLVFVSVCLTSLF